MRPLMFVLVMLLVLHVEAQQFSKAYEISLPAEISHAETKWIDVDNDGLLDNVIFTTNVTGQQSLSVIKGDTLNPRTLPANSHPLPEHQARLVYDYEGDNDMDIVLSSTAETFLVRNSGSGWSVETTNLPAFTLAAFVDVNHDGKNDCIVSGHTGSEKFTQVYSYSDPQWILVTDTLQAELQSIHCVDFDKDGWKDLFLSGIMEDNKRFASFFIWEKGVYNLKHSLSIQASSTIADTDLNGFMDVVGWGLNDLNDSRQFIINYNLGQVLVEDDPSSLAIIDLFLADLNSDGKTDNATWSRTGVDSALTVTYNGAGIEALPSTAIRGLAFGDMEHDGDLDLVQIIKDGVLKLVFYENDAPANKGPEGPSNGLAIQVYDHLFMYWEPSIDDHTAQHSITYDVRMEAAVPLEPGQFDVANGRRLTVSPGNNGNANFKLIRDANAIGNFGYAIQSVDNAYHAGEDGICIGSGFQCVEQVEQKLSLCTGEVKALVAPPQAMWFSLSDGFITKGPQHTISEAATDTLFSFVPDYQSCSRLTTYLITVDDDTVKRSAETLHRCEGQAIELNGDGNSMQWTSENNGDLGSGVAIEYTLIENDMVTGRFAFSPTCAVEKEIAIFVSMPPVQVNPEESIIALGGEVSLHASGATSYEWAPAEKLSNPSTDNPIAAPSITTEYTVTGRDSIGCLGTATALVKVEGSGFLPSLFTPNGDGKNDALRVYGLVGDTENFTLVITNRSGSTVFKTNNLDDALSNGWDGSTNGAKQPNGVYFWRVEGVNSSGEKVMLNGKRKGSILLLR